MFTNADLMILTELRKNARISLTGMSKITSIPVSTIHDKIKLHNKSLIIKHTSLIDFSKLGYGTKANILLRACKDDLSKASDFFRMHSNVNSICRISSRYNFLVEAYFRNLAEAHDFEDAVKREIPVEEMEVFYVLEEIKKESFMVRNVLKE